MWRALTSNIVWKLDKQSLFLSLHRSCLFLDSHTLHNFSDVMGSVVLMLHLVIFVNSSMIFLEEGCTCILTAYQKIKISEETIIYGRSGRCQSMHARSHVFSHMLEQNQIYPNKFYTAQLEHISILCWLFHFFVILVGMHFSLSKIRYG